MGLALGHPDKGIKIEMSLRYLFIEPIPLPFQ